MLSDYFSEINDHGTVVPVKDMAAFPRSEQAVLGAKNFALANRATTQTISLMDFTVDSSDVNVVTVNGTNSAEAWFNYMDIELPEGNYIGSGCTNGSDTTYMLSFVIRNAGNTGDETTIKCFNGDVNITVPSGGRHVRAFIVVRNGKTLTNQLFKLMIRPATDPDPTYAPHAMTNKELTDKVTPIDIKSSVTMTEQSHYTIDGATNISRNGIMGIINGVISSADVEEQPVGHGWTTVMTGLPKAFKASATMVPASNPAKNPLNINITTNGELNMRGGSVGEYYYFNLTYLIQ